MKRSRKKYTKRLTDRQAHRQISSSFPLKGVSISRRAVMKRGETFTKGKNGNNHGHISTPYPKGPTKIRMVNNIRVMMAGPLGEHY